MTSSIAYDRKTAVAKSALPLARRSGKGWLSLPDNALPLFEGLHEATLFSACMNGSSTHSHVLSDQNASPFGNLLESCGRACFSLVLELGASGVFHGI